MYARWPWYVRFPSKKTSEPNLIWPLAQMRLRLLDTVQPLTIVCRPTGTKKPSSKTLSATNSFVCASGTNLSHWKSITCATTSTSPIRTPCALALWNRKIVFQFYAILTIAAELTFPECWKHFVRIRRAIRVPKSHLQFVSLHTRWFSLSTS